MQSFTIPTLEFMALKFKGASALESEINRRAHELGIEPKRVRIDQDFTRGGENCTVFGDPFVRELEAWEA